MADEGRSPLTDMLPESSFWFAEFKQMVVNVGEVAATSDTDTAAVFTLAQVSGGSVLNNDGFALSSIICNQLPANEAGTDWYNIGAANQFAWGFAPTLFGDIGGGVNSPGHMASIALIRNHPTAAGQWTRIAMPWSTSAPEAQVASTAPVRRPAWDILGYFPFPTGSLSNTSFREIERQRSFEADPVRFRQSDTLSVCLVLNANDGGRLASIAGPVLVTGYAHVACKLRLPRASTRWNL